MSDVAISVVSDPEAKMAGNAVIRLTGVGLVPPGSTFRIDPLDDGDSSVLPQGWPSGDLVPLSSRITTDGVDLVVGPEVVEAPALLPGTPVTISVASVGARTELRWPSLPVARTPRRSAVVMSGQQLVNERVARDREHLAAVATAAAIATAAAAAAVNENHPVPAPQTKPLADDVPSSAAAEVAIPGPAAQSSFVLGGVAGGGIAASEATPDTASPRVGADHDIVPIVSSAAAAPIARPVPPIPAPVRVRPTPQAVNLPPPVARATALPAPQALDKRANPAPNVPPDRARNRTYSAASFGLGCLSVGAVTALAWWFAPATWSRLPSRPNVAEPVQVDDRASRFAQPQLSRILTIPTTSPLGRQSTGVNLDEALALADEQLHGPAAGRNGQEARYWLRKALATGLGDERLLWAMTQLGSLYARPDAEVPDYASARLLWELASSQDDPVAACFLATLHENGLGMPVDRRRALELYETAKRGGGCRGIDEAIARLGRNGQ